MYKVSVPVMVSRLQFDKEKTLVELKRMKADRVFLVIEREIKHKFSSPETLQKLKELIPFFENNGFETGVWIGESIGHGWGDKDEYSNMVDIYGRKIDGAFCPLDNDFSLDICDWIKKVAETGARIILMDDDFRMWHNEACCFCDRHLSEFAKRTGENLNIEEIRSKAYCGKRNKYRDVWLGILGNTLKDFARKIRNAVDSVDKSVRIGLCSCVSSWDIDGVDAVTLSKILAGENKPLLRFIYSPYWSAKHTMQKLHMMIDAERMQAFWCKDEIIETMSEGDTYPRPRFATPASYLEGFDTALRAEGNLNGILKYAIDYYASPAYETGYVDAAARNRRIYEQIDEIFSGKKPVGVVPYSYYNKIAYAHLPKAYNGVDFILYHSANFLSANSIPIAYEGDGIVAVFDEDARHIDLQRLSKGGIINAKAAKILSERGLDVGIERFNNLIDNAEQEYYISENEFVRLYGGSFWNISVKPGAKILSYILDAELNKFTGAFIYENESGAKFLVYPFELINSKSDVIGVYESYCRQRQLIEAYEIINGKALPAVCAGHPGLYILCSEGNKKLSVGLWNFFADPIIAPEVKLAEDYSCVRAVNCSCSINGRTVKITDIPAFSFAFFEVS